MKASLILRIAAAITLLAHSIPVMLNNGVNDFGNLYLDKIGFAPFGLFIAWSIKISHVLCAIAMVVNRYIKAAAIITIAILIAGIIMIHYKEGWFVVGLGRNGMEFNFLFICVLAAIMMWDSEHLKSK